MIVHDHWLLSLLPYVPAMIGLILLAWLLEGRWRGLLNAMREANSDGEKEVVA